MTATYAAFLQAKAQLATAAGLEVDPGEVHPALLPHQRDSVVWAVRGGRRAIFASFGLGKCHGAGTEILMADGSIKKVEDICVGE